MKKIIFLTVICFAFSIHLVAQPTNNTAPSDLTSIDGIISTLYDVISGEKNEVRNWNLFKSLFHTDARLMSIGKNQQGETILSTMTPDEYIARAGKYFTEMDFFEKEIHRTTNIFGRIAHLFSTYESYDSATSNTPFERGINSIQLFNDGERWWIVTIYWTNETDDNPLPKEYLPTNKQ